MLYFPCGRVHTLAGLLCHRLGRWPSLNPSKESLLSNFTFQVSLAFLWQQRDGIGLWLGKAKIIKRGKNNSLFEMQLTNVTFHETCKSFKVIKPCILCWYTHSFDCTKRANNLLEEISLRIVLCYDKPLA